MDLVKIGFQINANGLKDANKELDNLLAKADKLNALGSGGGQGGGSGGSGTSSRTKKLKDETNAADKMIQKQQTINQLLPYMDKGVANLASSFWLVSKEAKSFNKFLDIMGEQDAIVKQKKQTEALVKEQQKQTKAVQSTIAQYEGLSNKSLGGGILDQIEQQNKGLEELRKQYQAEAKEADKKAESVIKAQEKQAKAVQDTVAQYENLSNKPLGNGILDQVEQQNKGLEELKKQYKDQEKEQQKALDDIETARQKHFSKVQKDYEKQQQAIVDTQQKAIDKQVKAQNTLNESNQKAITLEQAKAKYVSQGYGKTDSTRLARLEVSGADVTTIDNYKSAIEDTTKAAQALKPALDDASASHSAFLDQVRGIAVYAVLSATIYGIMTAITSLAVATVQMADEYTAIQNRMKLYVKDADTLIEVNQKLAEYSMENNVGLRETSTLFARIAPSMQRLGRSTGDITTVVDAFGKSMRIGGATAMEAASATIQLSQALASGKLAGDEFRSISEASPRFLQAIAEGSGIAAAKLKEMSSAGMLTTKVITEALIKSYGKLSEENSRLGITLEQGANAIKTAFTVAIGEFNEGAGITRFFGESLMDLAISFKELSTSAKANGEAFKQWISDNENNIALLGKTATIVASIMVGKLVASFTAVMLAAIKVRVQTLALNASIFLMGNTARSVTGLMNGLAVAISRISFAGWVGIAATVASVALGFSAFKESTSEATTELVSHNKYVAMTTEELKALGVVQRDLAKFNLNMDLSEAEKNVKSAKNEMVKALDDIIYKWDFIKKAGDNGFVEQYDAIIASVKSGQTSYDQAIKQLSELGAVTPETAKELSKMAGEYDKTVDSMLPLVKVLDTLGIKHKITKDATANGRTENELYKRGLDELKSSAIDAGDAIGGLAAKYKQAAEILAGGIKVGKITGIRDQSIAEDIYKDANDAADNLKGRLIFKNPKGITADGLIQSGMYDDTIAQGKEVLKLRQQSADFFKKETATKKSDINNYPEQIAELERLNGYLQSGVGLEVAKVASQKDYVKWYGANLTVAQQIVAIEERRVELERALAQAQTRKEAKRDLKEQIGSYDTISQFMQQGYSYSIAQQAVSSKFKANSEGIAFANNALTASLKEQLTTTEGQRTQQQDILDFVKGGLSVEEATVKATIYRNNHLNKGLITLAEATTLSKKQLEYDRAKVQYWSDANALNTQANDLAITQDNTLASLTLKYKGIGVEEAKSMLTKQRIVGKLTEYNDLLEKQKSLALAIESVDFNVFGDFGNPFQSALEGLNALLFGMNDLKTQYAEMYDDIDGRIAKEEDGSKAQLALIQQKINLEKNQVVETKKARDKAITSGLSLTKSLFKEESKGYKVVSGLEKAYQASKIAFALWEKKDTIKTMAIKLAGYAKDMAMFIGGIATKITAQMGLNVVQAQGAVASAAQAPPPVGFASAAAMIALMAGIGIAISSSGSSGGEYVDTSNQGTGTVFGDSEAQSASIANSIDLLSENSDLMLPLTSAMLRSLKNIESSIGGVTNLILRQETGKGFNITEGFNQNAIGGFLEKAGNSFFAGIGDFLGINKMLGGLLGGLFGTSTKVKASGLYGGSQKLSNILADGFKLQEYVDVQIKKKVAGVTTSNKTKTKYTKADAELSKQFTLIFEGFYDSILSATDILGADLSTVENNLKNAVVSIGKINLKGLSGEQIQEKLEAVFGAAADSLAKQAFGGLEDFQTVGEGYYETLVKVASAVEEAAYYTDRLNVTAINYTNIINKQADDLATEIIRQSYLTKVGISTIKGGMTDLVNAFDGSAEEITDFINALEDLQEQLFMTGKSGDYLTSSMILGAGGLDSLASGLDAYFEMLSPAEQAAELTRRLTNEFAIFGKELPADVKAFRNLVSSIDITTEAGQKLYGQIIALAPEFNDLQDALDSANSEVNALVQSLRDLAEQARAARGETEQPRNLAYLRNEFESASILAMQGDTEAANRLLTLGKDLMQVSKLYSVTGSEYAKDLALIQRAATVSADVQESGLGTSISSDLTPSTGNTTTPVVETTNTTTDSELKGMREDLNAGLLAIAKFTQSIDARQDRWDYGDRLLVRVEQDGANDKIPVTTV